MPEKKKFFTFSPTVTLGDLLMLFGFIGPAIIWGATLTEKQNTNTRDIIEVKAQVVDVKSTAATLSEHVAVLASIVDRKP